MQHQHDTISVMVVDDEKDIRDGCERILARKGYQIVKASRGEEALHIIKHEPVSIVLLDLMMPGIDGIEVLRWIRRFDNTILVIVITGYATIETAIEAMKQGAYDFIPKPFSPEQLRIRVSRAFETLRLRRAKEKLEQERKKNLADLHTEKSRIRTIIESLPSGVVVTNFQGQVVLMNPAFLLHLGLKPDRMPGELIQAYVPDQGFCNLVLELSQGKHAGLEKLPKYEFILKEEKYFQARGRPVQGEEMECLGAVVVLEDITTLKVLDQVKSEFVAKVSHELRSPLSTIHEQLALVLNDMVGDELKNDHHILTRAKEKTRGMISLIGDLLDLSHIEAGILHQEPKPVCLEELLKNIVDFLGTKAKGQGQNIILELPKNRLPLFTADPMVLESIFGNLVTNAINYTPDGGEVGVSANADDETLQVAIKDNGFGIEGRHLEKIFERFYRVKDEKTRYITGTGLGLPIVKGLLDSLGGTISVQSTPGKGSTFTVRLPVRN
jgi:PAS domain S-box-containing protein